MKKVVLLAFAMMVAFSGFAQAMLWDSEVPEKRVTWGVRGGLNVSNIHVSVDKLGASLDSKVGYRFGVSADIAIVKSFAISTGLYYSAKGAKADGGIYDPEFDEYDTDKLTISPAYLELPIYASYRVNFAEASQLQINFGPYLAYGVNGKVKLGDDKVDVFGDDGFRRFDAGLGVGAGYTFNHFYVGLDYQFGLANIADTGGIGKITNRNFNISIGYNF